MRPRQELVEKLLRKYERYVAPFTFIAGFLLDTLTLQRIDLWLDHLVILLYLLLAGAGITILNLYESGQLRFRVLDWVIQFVPVVIQFGFGGLFSAFVIFYTKSAAFSKSWLFLAALVFLLIGNERFRKKYQRLTFQLSIFFVALFSYSIFALPIVIKKMGVAVFLLGGLASLGLVVVFILFLAHLTPKQVAPARRGLKFSILGIYAIFNVLYFTNIIPPAPLSLKEGGIYHSVFRKNGSYEVSFEPAPLVYLFKETSPTYHWHPGEPVYFFSSVFAPAELKIPILHRWSYYDKEKGIWVPQESIRFSIIGGRDGGYRGYSYKTAVEPGKWRVEVVTERGQVLGRETFTVVETGILPQFRIGLK